MFAPEFDKVPDGLPWLVSFPRTGSHRLRVFLELYFDRPMLTRHFFEHASREWLLMHDHDVSLRLVPNGPVVYLWREPGDTVFSQMTYDHGPDVEAWTADQVGRVCGRYAAHLDKWLTDRAPVRPSVVLRYEDMSRDPASALTPVVAFFGGEADGERIRSVNARVTHDLVAERSAHDPRVMDQRRGKEERRAAFKDRFGGLLESLPIPAGGVGAEG